MHCRQLMSQYRSATHNIESQYVGTNAHKADAILQACSAPRHAVDGLRCWGGGVRCSIARSWENLWVSSEGDCVVGCGAICWDKVVCRRA
jgi:hypothetical protein